MYLFLLEVLSVGTLALKMAKMEGTIIDFYFRILV